MKCVCIECGKMEIKKNNLVKYIDRKIQNSKQNLDIGTLMHIKDWIREYKPKNRKS